MLNLFEWQDGFWLDVLKPTIRVRNQETGQSIEVKALRPSSYGQPSFTIHTEGVDLPTNRALCALTVKVAKEDALKIDDKWTLEISGKVQLRCNGTRSSPSKKHSSKAR